MKKLDSYKIFLLSVIVICLLLLFITPLIDKRLMNTKVRIEIKIVK